MSVSTTAVEARVPPAVTRMVKPALRVPATTGVRSAVLSTLTSGHCTVMVGAVELLLAVLVSLVELTLAGLMIGGGRSAGGGGALRVVCPGLSWATVPKVAGRGGAPARVLRHEAG